MLQLALVSSAAFANEPNLRWLLQQALVSSCIANEPILMSYGAIANGYHLVALWCSKGAQIIWCVPQMKLLSKSRFRKYTIMKLDGYGNDKNDGNDERV